MKVFLAVLIILAFCFVGLAFNIIFRKNGQFPETEISRNKNMKKLGIHCVKEDEMRMLREKAGKNGEKKEWSCEELGCSACSGCDIKPKNK